jgi:hypothetical protein
MCIHEKQRNALPDATSEATTGEVGIGAGNAGQETEIPAPPVKGRQMLEQKPKALEKLKWHLSKAISLLHGMGQAPTG